MKTILIIILMLLIGVTGVFAQDKPAGPSGCLRAEVNEYEDWLEHFGALFQAFIEAPVGPTNSIAWDRFVSSLHEHAYFIHSECDMIREGYLEFIAWYGLTGASILIEENRGTPYEFMLVNSLIPELWLSLDWDQSRTLDYNPA